MKIISSVTNATIKEIKKLHDTKKRKQSGLCLVEGIRVFTTFLNSPYELQQVFVTQKWIDEIDPLVPDDSLIMVSDEIMQTLSQATTASGIVGVFKIPKLALPKELPAGIVLAQLQDPGNMGTLIRTAVACNVPAIYVVESTDPWSYKSIQSTAGTLAHATVYTVSWKELVAKKGSRKLTAFVVKDGEHPQQAQLAQNLLVIGNEANGLPAEWQKDCEQAITLPMPGPAESLNAAVAGSLALYIAYVL